MLLGPAEVFSASESIAAFVLPGSHDAGRAGNCLPQITDKETEAQKAS